MLYLEGRAREGVGCCRDAIVGGGEEVDVLSIGGWAGEGVWGDGRVW